MSRYTNDPYAYKRAMGTYGLGYITYDAIDEALIDTIVSPMMSPPQESIPMSMYPPQESIIEVTMTFALPATYQRTFNRSIAAVMQECNAVVTLQAGAVPPRGQWSGGNAGTIGGAFPQQMLVDDVVEEKEEETEDHLKRFKNLEFKPTIEIEEDP